MNASSIALYCLLLPAGLLGPGWLLGRLLNTPSGVLGAFLGSAALLMNLDLALDFFGLALSRGNVALSISLVALGLTLAKISLRGAAALPGSTRPLGRQGLPLLLPAAVGLTAVLVKAGFDPLSGLDTKFRWNFLALQMARLGHLNFYPPVSDADFLNYPWCDGIAPLVSSLYHWAYVCLDATRLEATFLIVGAQAILLFWAVFCLAATRGGTAAGFAATAVLATSAAFLSGVAIGQETGLTALALVSMFLFLERHRESDANGWLVWAGIAAGVGGLAREYGLAFIGLGLLTLARRGAPRRVWGLFAVTALVVTLPWYLRNWLRTGHPLFSHEMGGIFPANPVHVRHLQAIGEVFGLIDRPGTSVLLVALPLLGGILILLGMAGLFRHLRREWPWAVACAVMTALWAWSVHQTAGGYVYSIRVLTPAFALAAVFSGLLLAKAASGRWAPILATVLTLGAFDAAQRTFFMPLNPWVAWRPSEWAGLRNQRFLAELVEADGNWSALANAADKQLVLTNDPFLWILLLQGGAHPVSLYSPGVRHLFGEANELDPAIARLRRQGFRFVLLAEPSLEATLFLQRVDFFRRLRQVTPSAVVPFGHVYDLYDPKLVGAQVNTNRH